MILEGSNLKKEPAIERCKHDRFKFILKLDNIQVELDKDDVIKLMDDGAYLIEEEDCDYMRNRIEELEEEVEELEDTIEELRSYGERNGVAM